MRLKFLASLSCTLAALAVAVHAQTTAPADEPMVNGAKLGSVATSTLSTPKPAYWSGEIFPLTHTLSVKRSALQTTGAAYDWTATGFNAEEWSRPTQSSEGDRTVITQTTRAYTSQTGAVKLPGGEQELVLITRTIESTFGNQTETGKFKLTSSTPQITFQPLPQPAPGAFAGAVGDFTLTSKLSTTSVNAGESVTWTLQLTGAGNWPEIRSLPARAISKDFDYVKPVIKRSLQRDSLFDGDLTEEILLIPTKTGTYQLGPIKFVYFNPKEGKYQMLTSETVTLTVGGSDTGLSATRKSDAAKGAHEGERLIVPDAPPVLPLGPLEKSASGLAPFSPAKLFFVALIPVAGILIFWLRLAAAHRWQTDPLRDRRSARTRIAAIIAQLDKKSDLPHEEVRALLFAWQKATAEFGGVSTATPSPSEIAKAIEHTSRGTVGSSWAQLWRDANRTLFGHEHPLPADWSLRAKAALSDNPLPAVPVVALFARRNLLPFLSLVALALTVTPSLKAVDAGGAAYLAGDFEKAEASWREAVTARPMDAAARYNLSLAAAQQDRWAESATQALAAFCLNPRDQAIRWQFNLSLDRSGIEQPTFTGLARGEGFFKIARQFSPGGWGLVLVLSSVVFALALGFFLKVAFGKKSRGSYWLSASLASLSLLVGVSAVFSIKAYGQLADRDIAVVSQATLLCTVPTDVNPGQKTSPLPAGSLARVDRSFLTWSHVVFSNGQTGWVRTELLTFLYK